MPGGGEQLASDQAAVQWKPCICMSVGTEKVVLKRVGYENAVTHAVPSGKKTHIVTVMVTRCH